MGCHYHCYRIVYAVDKRKKLTFKKLLPGFCCFGIAKMGVGLGISMAREMLEAAGDALLLKSFQVYLHHLSGGLRVIGKSPWADDDVLRIGVNVGNGGEIHVKTVFVKVSADALRGFFHGTRAIFRESRHALITRQAECVVVRKACNAAAFLVNAQERTPGFPLSLQLMA